LAHSRDDPPGAAAGFGEPRRRGDAAAFASKPGAFAFAKPHAATNSGRTLSWSIKASSNSRRSDTLEIVSAVRSAPPACLTPRSRREAAPLDKTGAGNSRNRRWRRHLCRPCAECFDGLLSRHKPDVVVLQDTWQNGTNQPHRIRRLNQTIVETAEGYGFPVLTFSRAEVRERFAYHLVP
jgi:hypothetical protein